ncbi:type 1 fimbrial major subunit FimA [Serratia sp. M24T3]|uniref:Type 1 fimbrial major subunit FimA n=1 Tax=Rouxiella sp. WC2420 TaxID=3234145 RepID=A0AB39VMA5_9GAMM|nr:type 1 fimbrial major subunit FimA [Serratia sp. M24T3]EIC85997.1 type-1 fimbrial protein subunit A [Serratia sp. M24T3]
MKYKTIALSVVASLSLVAVCANATAGTTTTNTVNGGTVHFTGQFVNAACAVSTDTADQTINLGQYRTASITAAGQTTTNIPFNIKLVNCDTTVATAASIAFTGTPDEDNSTLFAVNAGGTNSTAASGVGIQLLDSASNDLPPDGTTYSVAKTLTDGDNTIPFTARYKSTAATVTAGQADADATFVIQYQ